MNASVNYLLCSFYFFLMMGCAPQPSGSGVQDHDDLYINSEDRKAVTREVQQKLSTQTSYAISNPDIAWTAKATNGGSSILFQGPPSLLDMAGDLIADSLQNFPKDRPVRIEFSFNNTDVTLTEERYLRDIRKFTREHFIVLSSCETSKYDYPNWSLPFSTSTDTYAALNLTQAIEGKGCLMLTGKDHNQDGYVISVTKYFETIYHNNPGVKPKLSSRPENTWIFFYAFGSGDTTSFIELKLREASPTFRQDFYKYTLPLDFKGWKQFAVKYSDLIPADADWNATAESGSKNPGELMSLEYCLKTTPGGSATTYLDKLIIVSSR